MMLLNSTRRHWFECFAGVALALSSQTSYRFYSGVGVGSVCIALCALLGVGWWLVRGGKLEATGSARMPVSLVLYALLILLPVTAINVYEGTVHASLRDFAAELLSFMFLLGLYGRRARVDLVASTFVWCVTVILLIQMLIGGPQNWYDAARLLSGANNPNQTALFCLCAIAMCPFVVTGILARALILVALLVLGFLAGSDAFRLAIVLMAVLLVGVGRARNRRWRVAFLCIPLAMLIVWLGPTVMTFAGHEWHAADQGHSRLTLFANGIKAWLSSPASIALGHGAGAFSGLRLPFEGYDSHNTLIQTLAVGGLVGFVICFFYPTRSIYRFYRSAPPAYLAMLTGVVTFALFQYEGRQPIWWVTLYFFVWLDDRLRSTQRATGARDRRWSTNGSRPRVPG